MKVSLKAGFGGNCILGQEVANFGWRMRIEGKSIPASKFGIQKIGYAMAQKRQGLIYPDLPFVFDAPCFNQPHMSSSV